MMMSARSLSLGPHPLSQRISHGSHRISLHPPGYSKASKDAIPAASLCTSVSASSLRSLTAPLLWYHRTSNSLPFHTAQCYQRRCLTSTAKKQGDGIVGRDGCGRLGVSSDGHSVVVKGWVSTVRDFGELAFILLRDGTGSIQLVATQEKLAHIKAQLSPETVIEARGTVRKRPEDMQNASMATGQVEIAVDDVQILNGCETLPYDLRAADKVKEEVRLKYRYLELRSEKLQHNIRTRSKVSRIAHNFLWNRDFIEVETPLLFRATVESGAKEFIVPTRQMGKFYALPQSPQQYKQILMAGGMEKYFQLAKCFRDEGAKSDRQPEFTQIDLEMSFITPEHIYELIESMLRDIWKEVRGIELPNPFPRMQFDEAISRFGSDKPDTRFAMEIKDITAALKNTQVSYIRKAIDSGASVKGLNIKSLGGMSTKECEVFQHEAKKAGFEGVTIIRVNDKEWKTPISKHLSAEDRVNLTKALEIENGDMIFMLSGKHLEVCNVLGKLRTQCATILQSKGMLRLPEDQFNFMWVVDFPLFSMEPDLVSTHHPFTAPHPDDAHLMESSNVEDLLKIRGLHYDCVVNGVELGGGSIRIHNHQLQHKVFEKLNMTPQMIDQFTHLLSALRYGCPPHGGIALGFDRMISLLCNSSSLREVIAFPKTVSGNEVMTDSPSIIQPEELAEFGITMNTKS